MIDGSFVYTNPNQEVKYWLPGRGFVKMGVVGQFELNSGWYPERDNGGSPRRHSRSEPGASERVKNCRQQCSEPGA